MKNYLINKINHPIYAVENSDILIAKEKGVLSYGFKIFYPNLYGKTEADFEVIRNIYNKMYDVLEENYIIQKTEFFFSYPYSDNIENPDFIEEFNYNHFKDRKTKQQISYIFFTSVPSNYLKYDSLKTNVFLRKERTGSIFKPIIDKEYISEQSLKDFERKKKTITDFLINSIFKAELLDTEEKFEEAFSYWENLNNKRSIKSDVKIENGKIFLSSKEFQTYTIERLEQLPDVLPEYLNDSKKAKGNEMFIPKSLLSPLGLELENDHVLNQFFYIPPQEQYLKNLKKKENVLGNFAKFFTPSEQSDKSKTVDEEKNEIFQNQIRDFRHEVVDKHQKVVLTHTNVIAEEFNTDSEFPINLRQNIADTTDIYFSTCIGNAIGLPADIYFPLTQEQAFSFFYCEDYTKGNSAKGFRVIDIASGNPIKLDIFRELKRKKDITAFNAWSVGKTGSGKSFTWNKILMHYFFVGEHIFNIDGSSSFERATEFVNRLTGGRHGFFMKVSTHTKIGLNPFLELRGEDINSKINFLKVLLLTILNINNESEAELVGNFFIDVLREYYERDMERKFDTFYEYFSDNANRILEDYGIADIINAQRYKYLLKQYYKGGIHDYLLNNTDERLRTIRENRYVTFQIKELKDDQALFSIVTLLLTNFYKTKLYDQKLLKFIKFIHYDEVWTAMDKPILTGFIKDTIKTVRSQNGGTLFTSQEPEDFFESEVIRNAVLNNSELGIILDIEKYSGKREYLQSLLSLKESEMNLIFSLGKKLPKNINCREFALLVGKKYIKTYGMEVSNEERAIYESDPDEKVYLSELDKKNGGNPLITAQEYAEKFKNIKKTE